MKPMKLRISWALVAAALSMLLAGSVLAQRGTLDDTPKASTGTGGKWWYIGSAEAKADRTEIPLESKQTQFRKLRLKVRDAALTLNKVVVTYDSGEPETIELQDKLSKGDETKVIELAGGDRKIKKIEAWYGRNGKSNGVPTLMAYGVK